MTQYAIVTDLNKCVGCLACSVACKVINNVEIGSYWNKVLRIGPNPKSEGANWPDIEMYFLTVQCQHCEDPECVKVCPTQASTKRPDGTVQIDKAKCIGCQFCVMSCPYGVRYLNKTEGVVEKCTLCEQRVTEGYLPQCVTQCSARARFFGDAEKGWGTFEAPAPAPDGSKDYEEIAKNGRITLDQCVKEGMSDPYTDSDIHKLPDVGNKPSLGYLLRNRPWKE